VALSEDQTRQIAEVNHWRGCCLDNFARVEQAILSTTEKLRASGRGSGLKLAEGAATCTRNLAEALKNIDPKTEAIRLLEFWSLREPERNELVHGTFNVCSRDNGEWSIAIQAISVKKGKIISVRKLRSRAEAEAFLKSITGERKSLKTSLLKAEKSFS
jgi:hypothetical protein